MLLSETQMLSERATNMKIEFQANGEVYRLLHVDKNVIQREILNPDVQSFNFPLQQA